ncbi:hypothetical protein RGQ29_006447 [Quercus rubra]|uniref:PGG domain-containing protein n=1 Tax=Quercus rubra TaxID=3512 RepID=A0AAN7I593_QUERU|nr:hypothetical protein RGQ29_006447 [Quercus rubra]
MASHHQNFIVYVLLKFPGQTKSQYLCLYRAAFDGNWQDAKKILKDDPDAIRYSITQTKESVLHIAFASKHMAFVKELVQFLSDGDLELRNQEGETALCFAAKSGIVAIAKEMVKKNNRLPLVRSEEDRTPLHKAALLGLRDMVSYLFTVTSFEGLSPDEHMEILVATITNDMYDIALEILKKDLATVDYKKYIAALHELARKPIANGSKSQLSFWKRCVNWFKGVRSNKASMQALVHKLIVLVSKVQLFEDREYLATDGGNIIYDAAKFGNSEFLNILIRSYPNIIWTTDKDGRSLFHIAVINRLESVFNLLYETVAAKEIILTYVMKGKNENVMHLAGYLAPLNRLNIVSGAALQMQRELLWFKGLEMIVLPSFQKMRNSDNLTPWDLFTKEHENLRRDGEKWMKDTANYCMLAATLIITVVFAAAFTVPGGSNQETGTPILLKSIWFRVFFIFDAIALLSSSTSALLFLSILTSRFTQMDFLVSLPSMLVWGLTALFISTVGVVVAFGATCLLVFKSEMPWLPIGIIASAFVPIIVFVLLHYQLWADIMRSTYWSGFLFKPSKHRIF